MKGIFPSVEKWAFDLGKETESDNNKTKIFSQISIRFVCWMCALKGERGKKQLEKKYPTASRQIDFSQVLSAFRISWSRFVDVRSFFTQWICENKRENLSGTFVIKCNCKREKEWNHRSMSDVENNYSTIEREISEIWLEFKCEWREIKKNYFFCWRQPSPIRGVGFYNLIVARVRKEEKIWL